MVDTHQCIGVPFAVSVTISVATVAVVIIIVVQPVRPGGLLVWDLLGIQRRVVQYLNNREVCLRVFNMFTFQNLQYLGW